MDVTWAPKSFTTSGTQIKGDWQFHFTVDKLVGNTQFVDQSTHLDGVTLLIQSIDKTDVSQSFTISSLRMRMYEKVGTCFSDISHYR